MLTRQPLDPCAVPTCELLSWAQPALNSTGQFDVATEATGAATAKCAHSQRVPQRIIIECIAFKFKDLVKLRNDGSNVQNIWKGLKLYDIRLHTRYGSP